MDNCPNCTEPLNGNCACMRNKCLRCENPVGNITFTVCDGCWDAERMTDNNNPTPPKSAEEALKEATKKTLNIIPDSPLHDAVMKAMELYASQFKPRYVTDAEIDEMFTDRIHREMGKAYRESARAMRDRIFGGKRVVYDKPFPIPNYDNPNETKL